MGLVLHKRLERAVEEVLLGESVDVGVWTAGAQLRLGEIMDVVDVKLDEHGSTYALGRGRVQVATVAGAAGARGGC